jgi:hypothetical protein
VQQVEQVVEARDLDAAHEVLNSAYVRLRFSSGDRGSSLRLASRMLGPVRFDRISGHFGFEASAEPMGDYVFGHLTSGRIQYRSDGEDRFVAPGDAFLSVLPGGPFTVGTADPQASMVVFSKAVVDEVADDVRFVGCRPL